MISSEYREGIILQGTRGEEYSVFRKSFELERDVDWTPPASSLSPPDWLKTSPFLASVSHSLSRTICHQVFWSLPSQHSRLCQSLYSYSVLNVLFRHLGLTSDEQGGGRGSLKFRKLFHTLRSKLSSLDWKAKVLSHQKMNLESDWQVTLGLGQMWHFQSSTTNLMLDNFDRLGSGWIRSSRRWLLSRNLDYGSFDKNLDYGATKAVFAVRFPFTGDPHRSSLPCCHRRAVPQLPANILSPISLIDPSLFRLCYRLSQYPIFNILESI